MKFGIFGYPNSGRKTLFELLTGEELNGKRQSAKSEGVAGIAPIRDQRLVRLAELYHPRKVTSAVLELFLAPEPQGVAQRDPDALEAGFRSLEHTDVLGLMVRDFEDQSVFHVHGEVNSFRDFRDWLTELLLRDQMFVEKRLERLQKELRSKKIPEKEKENHIFEKLLQYLESGRSLRTLLLTDEEKKRLRSYTLFTLKPMLLILNVDEERLRNYVVPPELQKEAREHGVQVLPLSVKLEHELAQLPPEDQRQFWAELNLEESALDKLTKIVYSLLGLITYFTVGSDEVRSWSVPAGSTAPRAARAIHADIERGFIRAELIKYNDLISLGSEERLKKAGLLQLKGRDYHVADGDILSFRFNV